MIPIAKSSQLDLTCILRASCYNTRLSWAHTPDIDSLGYVSRTVC